MSDSCQGPHSFISAGRDFRRHFEKDSSKIEPGFSVNDTARSLGDLLNRPLDGRRMTVHNVAKPVNLIDKYYDRDLKKELQFNKKYRVAQKKRSPPPWFRRVSRLLIIHKI